MNFNQAPYSIQHGKAVAGMVADGEVNNSISRLNQSAQTLQYGRFVARAGDANMAPLLPATTAENILGVLRYELNQAQGQTGNVAGVPPARTGSILTMGAVYVEAVVDVVGGTPVFVVNGAGADTGKVSNVVGSGGTAAIAFPDAIFAESAKAGDLVKISLKIGG